MGPWMWIRSMYIELKPLFDPLQRHLPTLLLTSQYHSLIPIATCWLFCAEFYSSPRKFVRKWILLHGRLQVTSKIGSGKAVKRFSNNSMVVKFWSKSLLFHWFITSLAFKCPSSPQKTIVAARMGIWIHQIVVQFSTTPGDILRYGKTVRA